MTVQDSMLCRNAVLRINFSNMLLLSHTSTYVKRLKTVSDFIFNYSNIQIFLHWVCIQFQFWDSDVCFVWLFCCWWFFLPKLRLRALSHLPQLSRIVLKHKCPPSPLPHCPALTLLQTSCAWARLSFLIYRARPVLLPAFFPSCNDIVKLFSGICNLNDSLGFFHCSLCRLCMLLSAWI